MQDLNWNDLKFVLAVSRTESLAGAARLLGVNETTVGRRINRAENRLGAQLFERNNGRLVPTACGQKVIASTERIELETQAIDQQVAGKDQLVAGSVRLTSVPNVLHHIVIPALPELVLRHPDLKLELISESRDLSLTKRETDIALRLARPTSELRAITRKIGQLDYAVYRAEGLHRQHSGWIQFDDSMQDIPQAKWISRQLAADTPVNTLVNDSETLLYCLKSGLGKSLLPTFIGDRQPALVRLDDSVAVSREIWLLTHPDLQNLARIRAVINWLVEIMSKL